MPKIKYVDKTFQPETLALIKRSNAIIAEYAAQGFVLTLRQLYYQLVSRDVIRNRQSEYKRLGSIVSDARLAGLIDWDSIEDRTRDLRKQPEWDNPAEIVEACAAQFRVDLWRGQKYRPEVWIEKDALVGVIEGVCNELGVPHFSCRGYTSQSEMWVAGQRLRGYVRSKQIPVIFHFGDHDPSGRDMTRDIVDRLELFMGGLEVKRLALNMDQVSQYNPPPNPAKTTDSRYQAYIAEFGDESWELDALEPAVIAALIRESVTALIETEGWEERQAEAERGRKELASIANNWDTVVDSLKDDDEGDEDA
jgi:hypothetical protein